VKRCAYCGVRCNGYTCWGCRDLAHGYPVAGIPPLDPLRDPVLRRRMSDSDLPTMRDELEAAKGKAG